MGTYLTFILLVACQTNGTIDQSKLTEPDTIEQTTSVTPTAVKKDSAAAVKEVIDNSNCERGQAAPIVIKSVYPNTVFKLNDDNYSESETVEFENGYKLIIENGGCEYYV